MNSPLVSSIIWLLGRKLLDTSPFLAYRSDRITFPPFYRPRSLLPCRPMDESPFGDGSVRPLFHPFLPAVFGRRTACRLKPFGDLFLYPPGRFRIQQHRSFSLRCLGASSFTCSLDCPPLCLYYTIGDPPFARRQNSKTSRGGFGQSAENCNFSFFSLYIPVFLCYTEYVVRPRMAAFFLFPDKNRQTRLQRAAKYAIL